MTISVIGFAGVRALPRAFEAGHLVECVVPHGDKRGRELGFPTANVRIEEGVAKDGVRAATVKLIDGRLLPATVSIGRRATLDGRDGIRLLEAHLLGYSEDLYGADVRVWISHRIRSQKRSSHVDDLIVQMQKDIDDTRRWANASPWLATRVSGCRGGRKGA